MPMLDFTAIVLRATDLFWYLAISDVDGQLEDRRAILDQLRALEQRCAQIGRGDLYAAVVEAQERRARVREGQ
jgi:hypothetical protein